MNRNIGKTSNVIVMGIVLLFSIISLPIAVAQPTADSISVADASGENGQTIQVPVNITNVANGPLQVIMFDVNYTHSVVDIVAVTNGDLLPTNSVTGAAEWTATFGSNHESITLSTGNQDAALADGSTGTIAVLWVSVVGTAGQQTDMNLINIDLSSTGLEHGTIPPINGTFTVGAADVPPTCTIAVTNTTITPPQPTDITATFSELVHYTLNIENSSSGAVVYDWDGNRYTDYTVTWDGTNETTGTQVPDGTYRVNLTVTNETTTLTGYNRTETITVTAPPTPIAPIVLSSIEVAPQTATLNITEMQQFTATALDQYGTPITGIIFTWSSSDTATGVIDQNGLFTANAPGMTTIKATNASVNGTATATVIFKADYTLFLATSWNFVSIPKKLAAGNNTVEDVFGDVNRSSHSIFLYNTSMKEWNVMNLTDEVKPMDGIWIYSAESKAIPITFDHGLRRTPPTKMLYNGWNAIGLSDTMPTSANDALSPVEDEWTFLIGFDAVNQQYQTTIINNNHGGDERDESNAMSSGIGYWVYMKEDRELAGLSV